MKTYLLILVLLLCSFSGIVCKVDKPVIKKYKINYNRMAELVLKQSNRKVVTHYRNIKSKKEKNAGMLTKREFKDLVKHLEYYHKCLNIQGVPLEYGLALMRQESRFGWWEKSITGCRGYMQISRILAKTHKVPYHRVINDPYTNIRIGTNYLGYLWKTYDEDNALIGYEQGEKGMKSIFCSTNYNYDVKRWIPAMIVIINKSKC